MKLCESIIRRPTAEDWYPTPQDGCIPIRIALSDNRNDDGVTRSQRKRASGGAPAPRWFLTVSVWGDDDTFMVTRDEFDDASTATAVWRAWNDRMGRLGVIQREGLRLLGLREE